MKNISILIPNWNGEHLLEECLSALETARRAYPGATEVILSDNASTDRSVAVVREKFPDVTVIENAVNAGFAVNANRAAAPAKHEILFYLSSDVIVQPDTLKTLAEHFETEDVFGATPRSVWEDGALREGRKTRLFKKVWGVRGLRHDIHNRDTERPCLHLMATGGHSAFDRKKFEALGGFDALFSPFYWEDSDLCHRAWKRGWKLVYDPRTFVIHKRGSVIHSRHKHREIQTISHRNRLFFMWRDIGDWNILAPHFAGLFFKMLTCLPTMDRVFMRSFGQAAGRLGEVLRLRRAERGNWKLRDVDVLRLASCDAAVEQPLDAILAGMDGGKS